MVSTPNLVRVLTSRHLALAMICDPKIQHISIYHMLLTMQCGKELELKSRV